jgi:hypothetical protein
VSMVLAGSAEELHVSGSKLSSRDMLTSRVAIAGAQDWKSISRQRCTEAGFLGTERNKNTREQLHPIHSLSTQVSSRSRNLILLLSPPLHVMARVQRNRSTLARLIMLPAAVGTCSNMTPVYHYSLPRGSHRVFESGWHPGDSRLVIWSNFLGMAQAMYKIYPLVHHSRTKAAAQLVDAGLLYILVCRLLYSIKRVMAK